MSLRSKRSLGIVHLEHKTLYDGPGSGEGAGCKLGSSQGNSGPPLSNTIF